jgi:glycerophosphoryl diester phosphodiesterase
MKNDDASTTRRSTRTDLAIVGHRGARALAPENTLAAIRKGLQHHVNELEVDVRITKDHVAILMHNADCQDASGVKLIVREHTYAELKQHKPDLTTLAEAIVAIDREVPLQIEVKWGEPIKPVVEAIQNSLKHGWQPSDFLLGSKKHATLVELQQALPEVTKVVIEPFSSIRAVWRANQIGTKRLSMRHTWLWSGVIKGLHSRGFQLYAYTLNDPLKARRWHQCGLAGVITDSPDTFEKKQT